MMKLRNFLLAVALCLLSVTNAQVPETYNSADIYMQLKKLNVLGSVLYIAAHPDDENNGLLPYLAKEKLYSTGYLSLTRGDGGQNLIGSEQGIDLGLIRTQELLAARKIDGAEQFFSRAYEFGFSKASSEALDFWDKEKILSDVVWMIRQYQPDVIIKRFPPDSRAGHGHHAASAILADEAFTAAADPKRFPEQYRYGVKPWQAKRILWNTFNFGSTNTTNNDQLKMNAGDYNPLIGKSYGELGGEARSMHKSQGEGRPRRRGEITEFFVTTAGSPAQNDLMDGITTNWSRIKGGASIQAKVDAIIANFNFQQPDLSVPALVDLYRTINDLPESNWRNKKLVETQNIIEACAALFTEAVTQQEYAVQGDNLKINLNFNNRSGVPAQLIRVAILPSSSIIQEKFAGSKQGNASSIFFTANTVEPAFFDSSLQISLGKNKNIVVDHTLKIDDNAPLSQPYWLENHMKQGYFDVSNQLLIGAAESKANYIAKFTVQIAGETFEIKRPVQYKYTDLVRGELYQPLTIIPKVTVSVSPNIVLSNVLPPTTPTLRVNYVSNINAPNVPVTLSMQNGGITEVLKSTINLKKGEAGSFPVKVKDIMGKGQKTVEPVLSLTLNGKNELFSQNIKTIKYDHIPFLHYFYEDNVKIITDEVKTVGRKIGYIIGAGDKVPDALTAMGFDVKFLGEDDINDANLQQFDAVIVGVRGHNIHEYLSNKNEIFNRYVQNGGNFIVQYMKGNQVGLQSIKVGPYPFSVVPTRVTEENAKVNFLQPKHPAFNYPNKITEKDFEGWVQERSTYQYNEADEHYEKLIGMNDTGENESKGSLVIAKYGKGNFAYVSLVLFRQLPAGVPGAYRLLANLIALPKNK